MYANVEISNFELIGQENNHSNLIDVKLDLYFHLNCTSVGEGDFLYLSPYEDVDEDPVLLIDDSYK